MSELRSAIEALQGEDLESVSDERLETDFGDIQRATQALESERLRRLAEIHRRQSHRRDGYLSTASWLVDRHRMGWTTASKEIRTARAVERMPHTKEALATGELGASAVQMLVWARQAHPAQFLRSEEALVEAARRLPARQLQHTMAHWRHKLDWEQGLKEAERVRDQRRLTVSTTLLGMVRVDGDLDPETGETVLTALRHCVDADRRAKDPDDTRTPAQRRADALGVICGSWLGGSKEAWGSPGGSTGGSLDGPGMPGAVRGERPHVAVVVDLRALQGQTGHRAELDHVGPVHPEAIRRISCDASVSRVLTRGGSEPLDIGRRTPVVPGPMRRALIVRDGRCRFPTCDRPPAWCDAHHVVHWANGGVTALSNLVLLCRRHHRLVHETGFRVTIVEGHPHFKRPDGSDVRAVTARSDPALLTPVPGPLRAGVGASPDG